MYRSSQLFLKNQKVLRTTLFMRNPHVFFDRVHSWSREKLVDRVIPIFHGKGFRGINSSQGGTYFYYDTILNLFFPPEKRRIF